MDGCGRSCACLLYRLYCSKVVLGVLDCVKKLWTCWFSRECIALVYTCMMYHVRQHGLRLRLA